MSFNLYLVYLHYYKKVLTQYTYIHLHSLIFQDTTRIILIKTVYYL